MSHLIPIEFQSQRVMTTKYLAEQFGASEKNVQDNFSNNKDRFVEGKHYYRLEGETLKEFKNSLPDYIGEPLKFAPSLILWTERGVSRHAKILDTDEAWAIYEELEETYFRIKQLKPLSALDALQQTVTALVEQQKQIEQQGKQLQHQGQQIQLIKETIITQPDNWRDEINRQINRIVDKVGGQQFQEIRRDSYTTLEKRARVDLDRRLVNRKARLLNIGKSKTEINKANKLDCIEEDPKLREIYSSIVKEYIIKFCT